MAASASEVCFLRWFLTQSASLFLFINKLRSLTFKVIIERYLLIPVILIVFFPALLDYCLFFNSRLELCIGWFTVCYVVGTSIGFNTSKVYPRILWAANF